jgi:hypothetical protein
VRKRRDHVGERLAYWRAEVSQLRSEPEGWPLSESYFDASCKVIGAPSPILHEAADFFGLDLRREAERALLLAILADVIFGKAPKGRPKEHKRRWSRFRLVRLAVDRETIKRQAPELSDVKAAAILKKRFPKRYRHDSSVTLRQKLREAGSWLDNARRIRADRAGLRRRLRVVE